MNDTQLIVDAQREPQPHGALADAWQTERQKSVGASECAALIDRHPWLTKLELYMRKVGIAPEFKALPRHAWGHRWERIIGEAYVEETGRYIHNYQQFIRKADAQWMSCTLDFRSGDDRVLDIKKISSHNAHDFGPAGSDEIPVHYALQLQQQMACAEVETADLAALIGDDDFRIYTVRLDINIVTRLSALEKDFMHRVAIGDPPLPDFQHPTTLELLNMIEPDLGRRVMLAEDVAELADTYQHCSQGVSGAQKARDELKARLLYALGVAEVGELPDGRCLRRKLVERKGYTVEPSEYWDFRILNARTPRLTKDPS